MASPPPSPPSPPRRPTLHVRPMQPYERGWYDGWAMRQEENAELRRTVSALHARSASEAHQRAYLEAANARLTEGNARAERVEANLRRIMAGILEEKLARGHRIAELTEEKARDAEERGKLAADKAKLEEELRNSQRTISRIRGERGLRGLQIDELKAELSRIAEKCARLEEENERLREEVVAAAAPGSPVLDVPDAELSGVSSEDEAIVDTGSPAGSLRSSDGPSTRKRKRSDDGATHCQLSPPKKSKKGSSAAAAAPAAAVRRSTRARYPPLAYWRGERLKYRMVNGTRTLVGVEEGSREDNSSAEAIMKRKKRANRKRRRN